MNYRNVGCRQASVIWRRRHLSKSMYRAGWIPAKSVLNWRSLQTLYFVFSLITCYSFRVRRVWASVSDSCFVSSFCVSRTLHSTPAPYEYYWFFSFETHMYQRNGGVNKFKVCYRSCGFLFCSSLVVMDLRRLKCWSTNSRHWSKASHWIKVPAFSAWFESFRLPASSE